MQTWKEIDKIYTRRIVKDKIDSDFKIPPNPSMNSYDNVKSIREFLKKPPNQRSETEKIMLARLFKDANLYMELNDDDFLMYITEIATLETYEENSIIYKENEETDNLYIILTGTVDLVSFKSNEYKNLTFKVKTTMTQMQEIIMDKLIMKSQKLKREDAKSPNMQSLNEIQGKTSQADLEKFNMFGRKGGMFQVDEKDKPEPDSPVKINPFSSIFLQKKSSQNSSNVINNSLTSSPLRQEKSQVSFDSNVIAKALMLYQEPGKNKDIFQKKKIIRTPTRIEAYLKHETTIYPSEDFGCSSLLEDLPRLYTAVASRKAELIKVTKNDFLKYMKKKKNIIYDEILPFFERSLIFKDIKRETKEKLAIRSSVIKHRANTVIIRQNDKPHEIYIIKKGLVKVLRKINKNSVGNIESIKQNFEKEFEQMEDEVILEVSEIGDSATFCDEILNFTPMKNTILTSMPTELICISALDIMHILSPSEIEGFKMNMKGFQTDYEVLSHFLGNVNWQQFKNDLFGNLVHYQ